MKKNSKFHLLLIGSVPFLLAMGIMGKPPALDRAPEPREKLNALVVDMDGISTEISCVSYEGELYLPVYKGKALITLPFQKISKIEFGRKVKSKRTAKIHFKNHPSEEFAVDERVLFVGKLPVGTYQIQVKDMESIEFTGPLTNHSEPSPNEVKDSHTR